MKAAVHIPSPHLTRRHTAYPKVEVRPFGKDGLNFGDILDVVNPLHHIPIIGSIYRKLTGDSIGALPRVAGGALFGGAIGLGSAMVSALVKAKTGKDVGETVLAAIRPPNDKQHRADEVASTRTDKLPPVEDNQSSDSDGLRRPNAAPAADIPELQTDKWMDLSLALKAYHLTALTQTRENDAEGQQTDLRS